MVSVAARQRSLQDECISLLFRIWIKLKNSYIVQCIGSFVSHRRLNVHNLRDDLKVNYIGTK